MQLDERKKKILSSVVEDYIASAEPVGSKTLAEKYNLDYSPATIRNEMKLLEEGGYLEQPHISAGRIPSTKGYRYYVDNLMKEEQLSMLDIDYINNSISGFGNTEKLLEEAADVVAKLLLRPTVLTVKNEDSVEHVKLVKISDKLLLVVLLSKNGAVKDCYAKLTDTVEEQVIEELSSTLNTSLVGTPLENLQNVLNEVISKELSKFSNVLNEICESIKYEISKENKKLSSNVESILSLPEFSDIDKAKNFVNMLSTKEVVDCAIDKIEEKELGIVIGSESKEIMLKDYSIISLNIDIGNGNTGKISVVTPKRIDYSKTISTLKYINNKFRNLLASDKKEGKDEQ